MDNRNRYTSCHLSPYLSSSGFSLIEMSLVLVIMAIVLTASVKLINAYRMQTEAGYQSYQISSLANAVRENAKLVLDAAATVCTQITFSSPNDGWGWRHSLCLNTSPFPVLDTATSILTYHIDTANFAGTVFSIINNIGPYCTYAGKTESALTFNCSALNITGMQYQTLTGPTNNAAANTVNIFTTPHTSGTNTDFLNFLNFPSALYIQYKELLNTGQTVSHYDMINAQTNAANFAYKLDLTDLYLDRVKKTRDGLITLDAALRGYAISAMTSEFENAAPAGLNSRDTFFVPWAWQFLASSPANAGILCNNSTTCSSITAHTVWAQAADVATFAQAWILILGNLLSSNLTFAADAFGDPLRILPIANNCSGDVSGCTPAQNTPPLPQGNYLAAMSANNYSPRPPYDGLIVSPLCTSNASYPDFCRWIVVYPN